MAAEVFEDELKQEVIDWYRRNLEHLLLRCKKDEMNFVVFFYKSERLSDNRLENAKKFGAKFNWIRWPLGTNPSTVQEAAKIFTLISHNYTVSTRENMFTVFPIIWDRDNKTIELVKKLEQENPGIMKCATYSGLAYPLKELFPNFLIMDYRFFCPPVEFLPEGFFLEEFLYKNFNRDYTKAVASETITREIKILQKLAAKKHFDNLEVVSFLRDPDYIQDYVVKGYTDYKYARAVQDVVIQYLTFPDNKHPSVLAAQNKLFDKLRVPDFISGGSASVVQVPEVNFLLKEADLSNVFDEQIVNDNMLHEAFVGLLGTNKLRIEIPNFVFIYGIISCRLRPNEPDSSNKISYNCIADSNAGNVIIYEKVSDSVSFNTFVNKRSFKESICVFAQVILALIHAYEACGFIHGDLHGENVLVKTYPEPVKVVYKLPNLNDITVTTRYIPVLIDYGFSQITYKGKKYLGYHSELFSPETQVPLTDAYKLAVTLTEALDDSKEAESLLIPFPGNIKLIDTFVDTSLYANLEPYEKFAILTMEDYFVFISRMYNTYLKDTFA